MMEFFAGRSPRLMLDEASVFDIASCVVDGLDVAPGRAIPDDGDPRIDHSLEGFMFTCGPDHLRHPELLEDGSGRKYPLHGSFSGSPAQIIRFEMNEDEAVAEAHVNVALANGGKALLERVWRIDGGTGIVSLADTLRNVGQKAFATGHMYHMNLGAKHLDDGVLLSGSMFGDQAMGWTFGEGNGHVFCVLAGEGEASVALGPIQALGGRSLNVSFDARSLPFLQMWRNQEAPAHVLGIEPVSHDWKPRAELIESGAMTELMPGDARQYGLKFSFA